jgi:hypothetical protein
MSAANQRVIWYRCLASCGLVVRVRGRVPAPRGRSVGKRLRAARLRRRAHAGPARFSHLRRPTSDAPRWRRSTTSSTRSSSSTSAPRCPALRMRVRVRGAERRAVRQYSHLITRRCREHNVYAELVPCTQKLAELGWTPKGMFSLASVMARREMTARGRDHPLRLAVLGLRRRRAARGPGRVRARRARARHLLRPAGAPAPARFFPHASPSRPDVNAG